MSTEGERREAQRPWFDRFASVISMWMGHGLAFGAAVVVTTAWALSGPIFHFSNTWQLIINTGTTVLTFLMVFLIQNTINRDSAAIHVKLNELLRASEDARNAMMGIERLGEKDLEKLREAEERDGEREDGSVGADHS